MLGFGSTEKRFIQKEVDFVDDYIAENFDDEWFEEDFVDDLTDVLEKRAKEYREKSDEYKEAEEYPQRYSYYYVNILHDVSDLCVIFRFSHINRNHALSPDGWAMMNSDKVFHAKVRDYRK